jgi:hypothetical protein
MFNCGMYRIEWYNKKGEVVKSEEKYLDYKGYNREVTNMQIAFLQGVNVESMKAIPLD